MVKKHNSFVNRNRILEFLLRKGKPVEWRKKIIGFGLTGSDFGDSALLEKQNRETLSRDVFNDYLNELLIDGHVTRLRNSDKRQKSYTITPLGICYLIWCDKRLPSVPQIFRVLLSFYDPKLIKSKILPKVELLGSSIFDELKKRDTIKQDDFFYAIKNNIKSSRMYLEEPLDKIHLENIITISLNISPYVKLELAELKILPVNQIVLNENNHNIENSLYCKLSFKEFYSYLSLCMMTLFFYNLYKVDNYFDFLFYSLNKAEKQKDQDNPTFQILNSLLKHTSEQMTLIGKDITSMRQLTLK